MNKVIFFQVIFQTTFQSKNYMCIILFSETAWLHLFNKTFKYESPVSLNFE